MMHAAAMILGISLMLAGLSLVGVAAGWWDLPDDIWGAILILLGSAGKYVAARVKGREKPAPENGNNAGAPEEKPRVNSKTGAAIIVLLCFPLGDLGCAGAEVRKDAEAWAKCAGGGALLCIPAAGHEDPATAALDYAACIARASIGCVKPLVARANPPSETRAGFDEGCVSDVAARCMAVAREDNARLNRYESQACIETHIAACRS